MADRILDSAGRLFRFQGYGNTGINQVIEDSRAAKASFYQHYPSKDDLGRAYLETYATRQLQGLALLMKRNPAPHEFCRAWMRLVKREARGGAFFGCPIANFRAQVGAVAPHFDTLIAEITKGVIDTLSGYLSRAIEEELLPAQGNVPQLARRLLASYHGTLQVWRLSGDAHALDELEAMCMAVLYGGGPQADA